MFLKKNRIRSLSKAKSASLIITWIYKLLDHAGNELNKKLRWIHLNILVIQQLYYFVF